MPLTEILDDLLYKHAKASIDPGGQTVLVNSSVEVGENSRLTNDDIPEVLLETLQNETNASYKDPGHGLQYVGLLLAVFAAELVSAHWQRSSQVTREIDDRGPAKMVSCLYSKNKVGFILSHPSEVVLGLYIKIADL